LLRSGAEETLEPKLVAASEGGVQRAFRPIIITRPRSRAGCAREARYAPRTRISRFASIYTIYIYIYM
jgi:hypothetical protein